VDCSLLRVELSGITAGGEHALVDIRKSGVLYAEISSDPRGDLDPEDDESRASGRVLAIRRGQWRAARSAAEGRKHLRFVDKKR
jgi:hypothetical protein